jgi:hypothetical protein
VDNLADFEAVRDGEVREVARQRRHRLEPQIRGESLTRLLTHGLADASREERHGAHGRYGNNERGEQNDDFARTPVPRKQPKGQS